MIFIYVAAYIYIYILEYYKLYIISIHIKSLFTDIFNYNFTVHIYFKYIFYFPRQIVGKIVRNKEMYYVVYYI